ncbi:hypothetical protein B0T18DRAFT_173734 [Schizothecium vesticola]|uniref:Uncharacterized protein n=1 Tax=Schizothecium vesticola TaxID=314040 RepID=A0AA40EP92_9PEZI|nr:hypothetical protein B0T18DRAFT_173734 [Schizothecium vesticola]
MGSGAPLARVRRAIFMGGRSVEEAPPDLPSEIVCVPAATWALFQDCPCFWSRIKCCRHYRKPQCHNCRCWYMVQHALSGDARVWRGRKGIFWLSRLKSRPTRTPAYLRPNARPCQVFGRFGLDSRSSIPPMKTEFEGHPRFRFSPIQVPSSKFHASNLCPDSSSPAALSRHHHARGHTGISREHPSPGLDSPGAESGPTVITRPLRPRPRPRHIIPGDLDYGIEIPFFSKNPLFFL